MGESSTVFDQTVKKKGYWNFKELYEFSFNWLKDKGFHVAENEYTEKDDGAKEIQLDWGAEKKVSDYFKNKITIKWHILQMKDAEVERSGKKQKTNKGDLKIKIKASLESDYEGRWEDSNFNKFLRGLFDKYIIKTTADEYEDKLENLATKFTSDLKAYLELSNN
jgi:hypothetical protein